MSLRDEIHVRFMGSIEVPAPRRGRSGYRWVDGYSVWVNGQESQPWTQKREAISEARRLGKNLGQKVIIDGSDWRHQRELENASPLIKLASARGVPLGEAAAMMDVSSSPNLPPGTKRG
jgi:hypothetical protein